MNIWSRYRLITIILVTVSLLTVIPLQAATPDGERVDEIKYIQVRNAKVRTEPKSFSKVILSLNYKDSVDALYELNSWYKVSVGGKTGYIHESALSSRRIVSSSSSMSPYADPSDVVVAGKGFNKKVEDEYKKQNPDKRQAFANVEKLEKTYANWNPSISSFTKSGKLQGEG